MSAAHEKQWVSTVLSAVDAADLRNLQVACLSSTPELIHQIRGHHKVPSYLVRITGVEPARSPTGT